MPPGLSVRLSDRIVKAVQWDRALVDRKVFENFNLLSTSHDAPERVITLRCVFQQFGLDGIPPKAALPPNPPFPVKSFLGFVRTVRFVNPHIWQLRYCDIQKIDVSEKWSRENCSRIDGRAESPSACVVQAFQIPRALVTSANFQAEFCRCS